MTSPQIKICGILNIDDAEFCITQTADFLGFIFYENSKRYISYKQASPIIEKIKNRVYSVAVCVNPNNEDIDTINNIGFSHIQLHGSESVDNVYALKKMTDCKIIKAFGVNNRSDLEIINEYSNLVDMFLLDAKPSVSEQPGGNAKTFDWTILEGFLANNNYFLSGGLSINNIEEAKASVKTNFFDISSGVESSPGIKDRKLITQFIDMVKL